MYRRVRSTDASCAAELPDYAPDLRSLVNSITTTVPVTRLNRTRTILDSLAQQLNAGSNLNETAGRSKIRFLLAKAEFSLCAFLITLLFGFSSVCVFFGIKTYVLPPFAPFSFSFSFSPSPLSLLRC